MFPSLNLKSFKSSPCFSKPLFLKKHPALSTRLYHNTPNLKPSRNATIGHINRAFCKKNMSFFFNNKKQLHKPFLSFNYINPSIAKSFSSNSLLNNLDNGTYYATTPIYYVNAAPHIGHLYSSVIVDALVRYHQVLLNLPSLLATGTDEHGLKVHQAAFSQNQTPEEFCDNVSQKFRQLTLDAGISQDYLHFIRTTSIEHKLAVEKLWNTLYKEGYIYLSKYEGWYSISDEAFYTQDEITKVVGEDGHMRHIAIESGSEVTWTSEPTYKFKLSHFQQPLLNWINNNPQVIKPSSRKNEILQLLKAGLDDLSISRPRARVPWGIAVPNDSDHVIYVWLDALCNYLTVAGYHNQSDISKLFPPDVQVVGKDIVKFHAVYWPAILMAAKLPLPKQLLAHGHWTRNGAKISKSRANGIDPNVLISGYGIDAIRFYLLRDGGNTSDDSDFSDNNLHVKYKKELFGIFGNLASRLSSLKLNPTSTVPLSHQSPPSHPNSQPLYTALQNLRQEYETHFLSFQFGRAIGAVVDVLILVNQYLQINEPWSHVPPKKPDISHSKATYEEVVGLSLDALRITAILLQPVIPSKSKQLLDQLNIHLDDRNASLAYPTLGWLNPMQKLCEKHKLPLINLTCPGGLFPLIPDPAIAK